MCGTAKVRSLFLKCLDDYEEFLIVDWVIKSWSFELFREERNWV